MHQKNRLEIKKKYVIKNDNTSHDDDKKKIIKEEEEGLTTVLACDLLLNRDGLAAQSPENASPCLRLLCRNTI